MWTQCDNSKEYGQQVDMAQSNWFYIVSPQKHSQQSNAISPWEFVNGRTMSHMLGTLKEYWEESHSPSLNVSDYLALHQERLNILRDVVRENVHSKKWGA